MGHTGKRDELREGAAEERDSGDDETGTMEKINKARE